MKAQLTLFVVLISVFFSSCKENEISALNGHYSGTFYSGSMYGEQQGMQATITILNGSFKCVINNDQLPLSGEGSVKFFPPFAVEFKDIMMRTADFDWSLILSGNYTFELKGDSLFLEKKPTGNGGINPPVNYYRLKRLK